MKPRLYSLTRKDISIEQMAVQSGHALTQYIIDHNPHIDSKWSNGSIICLELANEKSLKRWIKKLEEKGIPFSIFREPDMNHEITSISLLDTGELLKGIPLLKYKA